VVSGKSHLNTANYLGYKGRGPRGRGRIFCVYTCVKDRGSLTRVEGGISLYCKWCKTMGKVKKTNLTKRRQGNERRRPS
jgi:hypothetical protein